MLRVVPDVNVLVSSLINRRGPAGRIRSAWRRGELSFVTSRIIIAKTDEVLHRPHIFNIFSVTEAEINRLLRALRRYATVTPHALNLQVVKDDPEDDSIIIAAVEGKADCIISGDRHLKTLGTYENISILSPSEFVTQYNIP